MRASALLVLPIVLAAMCGLAGYSPWKTTAPRAIPPQPPPKSEVTPPAELPESLRTLTTGERRLTVPDHGVLVPTAIVLHSTSGLTLAKTLFELEKRGMGVHVLVDADGRAFRLVDFGRQVRAARGIDDSALHVSVVGTVGDALVANEKLLDSAAKVVAALADHFAIPKSNLDVISKRGVFSHMQTKFRWGGIKLGEVRDGMEPGEVFMKALLTRIGGTFVEEKEWKDREGEGWTFVKEGKMKPKPLKGRGITPLPERALKSVQVDEEHRQQYAERGPMAKVLGVVLHYTFTDTFEEALLAFEQRQLGPSIMIDVEGQAFQLVDRLDERVAAAAGTNESCIQIEIVGKGEVVLLANSVQMAKVAEVVAEICEKYSIPKTNRDVDSLQGVFSHTQAKKRWGRSAWLWGKDFDPGERYMRKVIEMVGGTYAEEKDWTGRTTGEWSTIFDDWLP